MIQRREDFGFTLKPGQSLGIGGDRRRQNLDRDDPFQVRVGRPIHLTHDAGADLGSDFIRAEPGTRGEGHRN